MDHGHVPDERQTSTIRSRKPKIANYSFDDRRPGIGIAYLHTHQASQNNPLLTSPETSNETTYSSNFPLPSIFVLEIDLFWQMPKTKHDIVNHRLIAYRLSSIHIETSTLSHCNITIVDDTKNTLTTPRILSCNNERRIEPCGAVHGSMDRSLNFQAAQLITLYRLQLSKAKI
jgi:hypothetical protein